MKLGTIYYNEDIVLHNLHEYIDYIKIDNHIDILDKGQPILVLGWFRVKTIGNLNILDKKIKKNIHWTFSFKEKKSDYLKYLNNFPNIIFDYYINNFKPKIISHENIFNILSDKSNVFINNNKILFIRENNYYYVLNLKEINYFNNIDLILFLDKIKSISKTFFYDKNNDFFNKNLELFDNVDSDSIKYLTPFIFFNNI